MYLYVYTHSLYLYLKYPDLSVGQLVKKRQALVKNHFLQELAAKLDVEDYGLYNRKTNLSQGALRHFSGNCIETILGAIFLDGGAEEAKKLFGRLAFSEVGTLRLMSASYLTHTCMKAYGWGLEIHSYLCCWQPNYTILPQILHLS